MANQGPARDRAAGFSFANFCFGFILGLILNIMSRDYSHV
ncbi:hypothetical protein EIO_2570 [Ketogulonicigenium vulgare Y25]|uniref:Uncharacterized protein n=1 Tax=Ketogulonicigenium vulgare (strain WSH-001) TaxID=759362 RepID=F9Y5B1_KETVW|nr:hypothetical protein EIO_2570 [Ketogulonicigenium vulgare Y25]AEM41916.1 hypothetical protein KVU_2077 [Ketogulonicigenium vulgare WSH-001]ALJ82019.1 hypothetical protein KVH_13115 [Ketogulonicigenium vulgare]AOZ55680.1 hypothetical protein KVC_2678 [Ketogulonicigenium vulgare]